MIAEITLKDVQSTLKLGISPSQAVTRDLEPWQYTKTRRELQPSTPMTKAEVVPISGGRCEAA
jgi:hypothetical protein